MQESEFFGEGQRKSTQINQDQGKNGMEKNAAGVGNLLRDAEIREII